MTGVFTMVHFYVWFLILISVLKTAKTWRLFLLLNIGISVIIGLYGFVQKSADGRLFSYLGNPLYLGVYSMMQIFFILFIICKDYKDKKQRKFLHILLMCALFFHGYIMFFSGSRTIFLSFTIGALIFLLSFLLLLISKK